MTAVALVQVRTGSTRLPGKALRPLAGVPLTVHVINRIKAAGCFARIVLAFPDQEEDAVFYGLAREHGIAAWAGSRDDVLARFAGALAAFPGEPVVRFCGDNPLLATELAPQVIAAHTAAGADWTAMTGLPLGCGFEVISAAALQRAHREATQAHQREHVTPYLREHPEQFKLLQPAAPRCYPAVRLTVDTADDLALLERIYAALWRPGAVVALDDALVLLAQHPEWQALNAHVRQKPPTAVG
ncbi:MAG TPA: glycosyltransferase family protein [bacterium]|nr:glycosyltransferase family protein [bacterium]